MSTTASTPPDPTSPDSPPPMTATRVPPTPMAAETPGFRTPTPRRTMGPDPMDPAETTSRPLERDEVSWAEPSTDGPPPGSTSTDQRKTGPSPGYTPDSDPAGLLRAQPGAYEGLIATAIRLGGLGVDNWRSPDTHVWLPTDDEVQGMTEPLARIAARHTPLSAGDESSDIIDGLTAMVVGAGYATRAGTQARQMRAEAVRAAANGQAVYPG